MKVFEAVLLALVAWTCLSLANPLDQEYYGVGSRKYKVSDKVFLQRQKDILKLFKFINQPCRDKDHEGLIKSFSIEANIDSYSNATAVKQFLLFYKKGLLPRNEIFSILYEPQLRQAISLFNLFYYAKDFDTFYKTAVWARNRINQGMFLYSFSVALTHREDTYRFILPPIYEIYPYYFFSTEVIQKAQEFKQIYEGENQKSSLIYSNYSGYYLNLNPEQSMSYYLEDIGINSFYYYCNIFYPFWMGGNQFNLKRDRRGEQYYYLYQQFLARYYLERLSNDFGEIDSFSYDEPFKTGFYPSLRYPNGLEFPQRPNNVKLSDYFYTYGQSGSFKSKYRYSYTKVMDYERRIRDTIDAKYVYISGKEIKNIYETDMIDELGNLIESNADALNRNYYGPIDIYARHLLGYSFQPLAMDKIAPSALEHFETAMRDPAFYQIYKRITLLFFKYKVMLPPYTYDELAFPGVKLEKIEFDKLITYFDNFDADLSNAVYVTAEEFEKEPFKIKVRQQRLNHKPFTYKIHAISDKEQEAVVRIFLGPKYDEYGRELDIFDNRINFVEIDTFRYKLQSGRNIIVRNSRQPYWYVPDKTPYKELYRKVMGALDNDEEFQIDASEAFYGFPNRFLLPIGRPDGFTYQIYTIINPYSPPEWKQSETKEDDYLIKVGSGSNYIDKYAFGFPFDRRPNELNFLVPNSMFYDITIYHKQMDNINSSQKVSLRDTIIS